MKLSLRPPDSVYLVEMLEGRCVCGELVNSYSSFRNLLEQHLLLEAFPGTPQASFSSVQSLSRV